MDINGEVILLRGGYINVVAHIQLNVSAIYKNTFKHLFPYTSHSSVVVNKLECLSISLEIVLLMPMNFAIHN